MKVFFNIVLFILVFLAISSGITKVMLMQQDVEFFGGYGFTNSILITYGAIQLAGGVLLVLSKTRVIGAALVAITFLISALILFMAGNIPITIITLACVLCIATSICNKTITQKQFYPAKLESRIEINKTLDLR